MIKNILNVWGPGQLLTFSGLDGETDFGNGLVLRTAFDRIGLEIKLPEESGVIELFESLPESVILAGDFFEMGSVRGAFADAHHVLMEGEITLFDIPKSISTIRHGDLTLLGVGKFFNPELIKSNLQDLIGARKRWLYSIEMPENVSEATERALYKACSQLKTQIYSPEGMIKHFWSTPDRWPHRRMWLWDSVFHAMGARHIAPWLARDLLSSVFDCQCEDGFIPLDASPDGVNKLTQPPVMAFGVKKVLESDDDAAWLEQCYPALKRYIEWDLNNRDTDGAGLLEWSIEDEVTCRSGESGMDNSPRFDCASQLDATDFNSFIACECEIMSEFADRLGYSDDALEWSNRHRKICGLINEYLWNPDLSFYVDYDVRSGRQSKILASSGFLPLLCGAASREQALKLAEHLHDPKSFGTPFPIPSISRKNEEYYRKDMWRGPVWVNINLLVAEGFRRYGMSSESDLIISKTIAELEKWYLEYGTFFEFMDDRQEVPPPDLLRKSKNIPNSFHQVFHDYGWSATLYIDMIFTKNK